MLSRKEGICTVLKRTLLLFIVAILIECFIFNFNFYASHGNESADMRGIIKLNTTVVGEDAEHVYFRITNNEKEIEFTNLNAEVGSLMVRFPNWQNAQALNVKIRFTDDAHATYFDTTEYTQGVPDVAISTAISNTQYINLNTTGKVKNLKIEFDSYGNQDLKFPIYLDTVILNPSRPFIFNNIRFLGTFLVLMLIYIFRPKSAIYKILIREHDKVSKLGIVAATAIEVMLVATFFFYGTNMVGVATNSYNYGNWDGKSIVNTFEVGGKNAQQYYELAKSISKGKFYLEEEPPNWLKNMSEPYDKGAREEAQKETGEDYLFDVAYYGGHYYVYFGVVPVILFYLPFLLLTGGAFPTAIGVLISVIGFMLGITALLHRFAKYHFDKVNLGLFIILQVVLVVCSGILYLIKFPTFYSLPISLGLAFTVWGLYLWLRGRNSNKKCLCYFAGSTCMALVVGCRPQLALLSFIAFPLFWRIFISKRHICTKQGRKEFICLILPYVIILGLIFAYNYARFGSIFDFGANYNLTVNDMTKRGLNAGRIPPAIFSYFFQTPTLTGTFPYLKTTIFETTYIGQTIRESTFGGIFACLPILWVLIFTMPILRLRNRTRKTRTITGVISILTIGGFVIAIADAELAGILQRYFADFSFMFLSSAILLIFIFNEAFDLFGAREEELNTKAKETIHLATVVLNRAIIVAITLSVLYSILLCFVPETGWYSDIYPFDYVGLIDAIQFWT